MTDQQLFGFGLELVDGDIVLERDFETGKDRLRTLAGKRNLLQALTLRVLTPFGSDRFNVTYGLDVQQAFVEPHGARAVKELIKLSLVRTLATDARVRDVREVLFTDDPAFLARHPELDARTFAADSRHRRRWTVELTLDTIDGQTVVLPAAIGA
jgi:hypothetical protein